MKKSHENRDPEDREIFNIADDFLKKINDLNPLEASEEGFSAYDDQIGDLYQH